MIATVQRPRDVQTHLNYFKPNGPEPPYQYLMPPPPGVPIHNLAEDTREIVVHDVRGTENDYTLDTHGFQWIKHTSNEAEFSDEQVITTEYYQEVEQLLKQVTGAQRILIFGHTVRRDYTGINGLETRAPVKRVHVDQTYEAAYSRVRHHLSPEDASRILQHRFRIINVWRPIKAPVAHIPLALADWRTLNQTDDLVPVRFIGPDREGAVFSLKHNPEHKWHFLADQTPEEVTLIKCFDSEEDGRARLAAHSAFDDATSPKDAPQRQSIEVRALVFDVE